MDSKIENDQFLCPYQLLKGISEAKVGYWLVKKELGASVNEDGTINRPRYDTPMNPVRPVTPPQQPVQTQYTSTYTDSVPVEITDNVGIVHDKLMYLGADMVIETVDDILAGTVKTIPQDDILKGEIPTPAPKIFKDTCHIDFNRPAMDVYNHIRGLSPYPAAWSEFSKDGKTFQIKIFETSLPISATTTSPGLVKVENGHLYCQCADGLLEILSLQLSGKKRMDSADFLRGFNLDKVTLE